MPRPERHRVGAGGDVAHALVHQGLGEHGGGGGAVTGDVVGLGGDALGQLRAEVLVRVVEVDLPGDGHAVVGDRRGAELLVDDDVAAARAEGHLDRVGELVDAALEGAPGVLVELDDLGHAGPLVVMRGVRWRWHRRPPRDPRIGSPGAVGECGVTCGKGGHFSTTASRSRAESTRYSWPPYLTSVPPYLRVDDHVAHVHIERNAVPVVVDAARADGEDGALLGLLLGGVRDDQTGGGGGLGLVGLDHDPVLQRLDADLGSGRHVGDAPFGVGRLADGAGADAVARAPGTRRRGGRAPARVGWHSTHESASRSTGSPSG